MGGGRGFEVKQARRKGEIEAWQLISSTVSTLHSEQYIQHIEQSTCAVSSEQPSHINDITVILIPVNMNHQHITIKKLCTSGLIFSSELPSAPMWWVG